MVFCISVGTACASVLHMPSWELDQYHRDLSVWSGRSWSKHCEFQVSGTLPCTLGSLSASLRSLSLAPDFHGGLKLASHSCCHAVSLNSCQAITKENQMIERSGS